jgi:hypothetical protein
MDKQQLRISLLGYGFGILQPTLRNLREIRGNEYVLKCNGGGIHGSHNCLSVELSSAARFALSGCTTTQNSRPGIGWL